MSLSPPNDNSAHLLSDNKNDMVHDNDYFAILSESKKAVVSMFVVSQFQIFMTSSRHSIWALYAEQFVKPINPTIKLITLVLNFGILWKGIGGLLSGSMANKFGYDKILIILLLINTSGVFMESITEDFIVLSIGYFLAQSNISIVLLAAIAWYLPHKNASKFTSLLNGISAFSYIAGPGVAGIVSRFMSYRWLFWINFILGCITLIYSVIFIGFNLETKLIKNKQSKIKYAMNTNDDIKFPIYIKKKQHRKLRHKGKKTKISLFECILLFLCCVILACYQTTVAILGFLYLVYIQHYIYPTNTHKAIIYGSVQLLLVSAGAVCGTIFIAILFKNRMFWRYFMILIASAAQSLLYYFIFPHWKSDEANMFYLYAFCSGLLLGFMVISTRLNLLVFQPPSKAGYIGGLSTFLGCTTKAASLLFIGENWDKNIIFDVIMYFNILAFISALLMVILHLCCNRFMHQRSTAADNDTN